jgi:hypothetical protein
MAMQQWVPFALLANYKVFCTAGNNNKYLRLRVSVCILALVIQRANFIFSAPYYIVINFSTLSHKQHDFQKKIV